MKYTQIPTDTFKNIQLNAGILLKSFTPSSATITNTDIIGATSGGINFSATPSFTDFGDDIDNCPKNTKELKKLESWEAKMSGTFVTVTAASAKTLMAAADTDSTDATKVVPRADLEDSDFTDIWWVGDYSNINNDETGTDKKTAGYVAIHMLNGLSTGGFQIQSSDKAKGTFSFEFTAHYSATAPDTVPFEVYVKAGTEAA